MNDEPIKQISIYIEVYEDGETLISSFVNEVKQVSFAGFEESKMIEYLTKIIKL